MWKRPKFILLTQIVLLIVILIFQLYITLTQPLNQSHLLKFLVWFYHLLISPVNLIPFLLISCLHMLIFTISKIINLSLSSEMFPSHFKHAHINPLLKKPHLPPNHLNSYIPISNLAFISKVLEKISSCRFSIHLNCNHLSNVFLQSAYKQFYSTETALLKVQNDIALNMRTGKVTALTLLD